MWERYCNWVENTNSLLYKRETWVRMLLFIAGISLSLIAHVSLAALRKIEEKRNSL